MKPIPDDILCVIPARAGSQGIKNKNLQLLGGIPLVEHSILHALHAGIKPALIFVSSDSDKILEIACDKYRVTADERPPGISGSTSSTEETLLHVLNGYTRYQKGKYNYPDCSEYRKPCEHVLLLQPTSPIRFKDTLNKFIDFYFEGGYDSALTTTEFHDFFWYVKDNVDRIQWASTYDPRKRPMRQSLSFLDDKFFDNGNAYITNASVLQETKCRLGENVGAYPISELEGMQIDTPRDLEIFRMIFDGQISNNTGIRDDDL